VGEHRVTTRFEPSRFFIVQKRQLGITDFMICPKGVPVVKTNQELKKTKNSSFLSEEYY
jgi:hypothetical protein